MAVMARGWVQSRDDDPTILPSLGTCTRTVPVEGEFSLPIMPELPKQLSMQILQIDLVLGMWRENDATMSSQVLRLFPEIVDIEILKNM